MARRHGLAAASLLTLLGLLGACCSADEARAIPSPSPPPDPCGGPGRLLATANRPTIGYSACAVERGTAVFELGYQNEVEGTASTGAVESQVPQAFTRLGLATRFELDIIGPNYESIRAYNTANATPTHSGVDDSGLGFKYEFPPSQRWNVAVDGLYTAPNGSAFLTAGRATFTENLDASYSMSPATSVGTTIAVSSASHVTNGTPISYGTVTPSFVITTQIPNYYQFYAEYVLVSKVSPDRGDRAFTDFGVQKLLGSRTEVDVEYGHAFTGIAALKFDYVGAGLVIQLR